MFGVGVGHRGSEKGTLAGGEMKLSEATRLKRNSGNRQPARRTEHFVEFGFYLVPPACPMCLVTEISPATAQHNTAQHSTGQKPSPTFFPPLSLYRAHQASNSSPYK
jgi:hypothetical protein